MLVCFAEMQPILFKDSANREQKQQACLILPFFRTAALRSLKDLLSPSKKQKRAETVASARLFCLQKRLFHDNFLNNIVGTHDVETCCHAGAGVGAYQCAGCCVDSHALCAVNNDFAVCSCDNHACYVNTCNA